MIKHGQVSLEEMFYGTATVGDRGQVVIPAEARKKFSIAPGDKMLVLSHPSGGIVLCKIDAMKEIFSRIQEDLEKLESRVASETAENRA